MRILLSSICDGKIVLLTIFNVNVNETKKEVLMFINESGAKCKNHNAPERGCEGCIYIRFYLYSSLHHPL